MGIRRFRHLLAAAAATACLAAQAGVILQDQGTADAAIQAYEPIGQSFVAEDTFLSTLALAFSDINPTRANDPVTLSLYQGAGFGGPVLRSVTRTLPATLPGTLATPQFIDYDFSGTVLTPGQTYTIGAHVEGSSFKVAVVAAGFDAYAPGRLYESAEGLDFSACRPECDLNFRVVPMGVTLPATSAPATTLRSPAGFLPTLTWFFSRPTRRTWFDPPLVDGFLYELEGGGEFTEVAGVPGQFGLDVVVNGQVVDASLDPGESYFFAPGVSAFALVGIQTPVDVEDPNAFPTFLDFSGEPTELRMTGLAAVVPEPGTTALWLAGAALLANRRRRAPA